MYANMGRTRLVSYKRCWTIFMVVSLFIVSIVAVFFGVWYIEDTWAEDTTTGEVKYGKFDWTGTMTAVWFFICLGAHIVAIWITRNKRREQANFRYNSQVFQQSLTVDVAADALASANRVVGTAVGVMGSVTPKFGRGLTAAETDDDTGRTGLAEVIENVPSSSDNTTKQGEEDDMLEQATQQQLLDGPDKEVPYVLSGSFHANQPVEGPTFMPTHVPLDVIESDRCSHNDDDYDNDAGYAVPSYRTLCRIKLYELCGCCKCFPRCKPLALVEQDSQDRRGSVVEQEKGTWRWRVANFSKSFLWYSLSFLALYLTIVNIGATSQQTTVRASLGGAFEFLYPPDYQSGAMCAWDEATPDGNIMTFESPTAVRDANYTLIHCGSCGACSNWNDLSLQWTTWTNLAKKSKKCAQKSLFGSRDDVQQCNEEYIGFTPPCAECWTVDELCASKNCFWIYLQSVIIDAVSDFRVGFDDITSATCDEALCGPVFVPCSGATRRRMNIKSDIQRPPEQQCTPVTEDWSAVFSQS